MVDLLRLPERPRPKRVETDASGVSIVWESDGHASHFSIAALAEMSTATSPPSAERWWGGALGVRRFPLPALASGLARSELFHELARTGVALVDEVPDRPGQVVELARLFGHPWNHHFGTYFEVEARTAPDSMAYTDLRLPPHTDLPSRLSPPGVQLLHCRRAASLGGETLLIDGFALVDSMQRGHPEEYEVLCSVPVTFRFQNDRGDYRWTGPMLMLDREGQPTLLRFNTFLLSPVLDAPAVMQRVRRTVRAVLAACEAPGVTLHMMLEPGQTLILDNWRILHGRSAYSGSERVLEGCYVERDELLSRLREHPG